MFNLYRIQLSCGQDTGGFNYDTSDFLWEKDKYKFLKIKYMGNRKLANPYKINKTKDCALVRKEDLHTVLQVKIY